MSFSTSSEKLVFRACPKSRNLAGCQFPIFTDRAHESTFGLWWSFLFSSDDPEVMDKDSLSDEQFTMFKSFETKRFTEKIIFKNTDLNS